MSVDSGFDNSTGNPGDYRTDKPRLDEMEGLQVSIRGYTPGDLDDDTI